MILSNYIDQVRSHYERLWINKATSLKWTKGPTHELPASFAVLLFRPTESRKMWTYATCGMSLPKDQEPIELHMFAPERNDQLVELLTAIAHYHRTAMPLGLGHTVNFGRPWLPGSNCNYGLISLPYLDGPTFEWMATDGFKVRFLWLIPITRTELNYKKRYGLESLENALEEKPFDYLDPKRESVIAARTTE